MLEAVYQPRPGRGQGVKLVGDKAWRFSVALRRLIVVCLSLIVVVLFPIDTLTSGVWMELAKLQDPELRRLAEALPDTVLHSRADGTTKKYLYAFQRWRQWAGLRREVAVFPVQEVHFALYLQHLGETVQSKSAVEEAVNAVSWVHQISGLPAVTASPFVRATLSGLQRKLAKPKVKKEPVTVEMLRVLVDSLGQSPSLSDIRLVASALLSFAAFLRYDEVAKLRCCDIRFSGDSMAVHLQSSKTDQYRQGDKVIVARTGVLDIAILGRL